MKTEITQAAEETIAAGTAALEQLFETADYERRVFILLQLAVLPVQLRWLAEQRENNVGPAIIISAVNNAARNMLVSTLATLLPRGAAAACLQSCLAQQATAGLECLAGEHPEDMIERTVHNVGHA